MKKNLIILLAVIVILFIGYKAVIFVKIDTCLDHGLRWNYDKGFCEDSNGIEFRV